MKLWLWQREKFLRLFLYYAGLKLLLFLLSLLFSFKLLHLVSLEKIASADLCLNDLHYTIQKRTFDDTIARLSGKVLLLNTGSLSTDSFRSDMAKLLLSVRHFKPAVIGVDIEFSGDTAIPGTESLFDELRRGNSIVATTHVNLNKFQSNNSYRAGYIGFPEDQVSIRRYFADTSTMAYKLASAITGKEGPVQLSGRTFIINYLSDQIIDYHARWEDHPTPEKRSGFLKFEASDVLSGDSTTLSALKALAPGRVIIAGHLGPADPYLALNDVEDKHRVPTDSNLMNRDRIMYGTLIHANAVENIINTGQRFRNWTDAPLFTVLRELFLLLFIAFLVFFETGKHVNVALLMALSIPAAYLVLYLMKAGIYLEMGMTLLQLLVCEEVIEIMKPLYQRITKWMEP